MLTEMSRSASLRQSDIAKEKLSLNHWVPSASRYDRKFLKIINWNLLKRPPRSSREFPWAVYNEELNASGYPYIGSFRHHFTRIKKLDFINKKRETREIEMNFPSQSLFGLRLCMFESQSITSGTINCFNSHPTLLRLVFGALWAGEKGMPSEP